jgi:hypothetical protein
MLTETAIAEPRTESFRWWFAPSWLGLDAPCVVSIWTWAVSRASHVAFPVLPVIAMFLVVWFVYLSDRCVDVAACRDWTHATGRLRFGRDHRSLFLACLGFCVTGILAVLWVGLPRAVILRAALVAIGVALHFLAFVKPVFLRMKLPGKEFDVGLFFAFGAYACLGVTIRSLPFLVSIAFLVTFNCLIIAARDADSDRANDPGGASHWWQTINHDLMWLGIVLTLGAALGSVLTGETAFYVCAATAFAALLVLHRNANRLSADAVRALADFALLTPIPIMGVMR